MIQDNNVIHTPYETHSQVVKTQKKIVNQNFNGTHQIIMIHKISMQTVFWSESNKVL
jgi:hypothetical protein